jgi:hypothetical protein
MGNQKKGGDLSTAAPESGIWKREFEIRREFQIHTFQF